MPRRILAPFFKFINNLKVRFQVSETIGRPHIERCSIPQGCPFSMALVALITRVWVAKMEDINVEPRCLADDLLFVACGTAHRSRAIAAMLSSRNFFHDLGARVATNKCFMFSTCKPTRSFLAKYTWDQQGLTIPVTGSFRDLGSHLNLTNATSAPTLSVRLQKAIRAVRRLGCMPITQSDREKIIRCNILPAALCGTEASHINCSMLQNLRSTIATAIGPKSARRCVDLTFAFTASAKDLDPSTHVLYNRVAALRRICAKIHGCDHLISTIIMLHHSNPSTPPAAIGPIGYLLQHIHACHAQLGADLIIRQACEPNIDLWHTPWQHLKKVMFDFSARARTRHVNSTRTFHREISEIDTPIVCRNINMSAEKEAKVMRYISTGAFWDQAKKAEIGQSAGSCPHYGASNISSTHIHWECQAVNQHRKLNDLCHISPSALPQCVKCGIPPAMAASFAGPFWGEDLQPDGNLGTEEGITIGVPKGAAAAHGAACDNRTFNLAMQSLNLELGQHNARQAFLAMKQLQGPPVMPMPYQCYLPAPDTINVYTDGSWQFPLSSHFALGGAGVWWPARHSATRKLSKAEQDLAVAVQTEKGLRLFTPIGGFSGSSTRTEIAAGIVAILAHGPIHIGSDSEVFVNIANEILCEISEGRLHKRQWSTTSDGDLWQHFANAAAIKTPQSIRLTWTKGHATAQHVLQGITTKADREGNRIADLAADEGVKLHGEEVHEIARLFSKRYKQHRDFMLKVCKHIIEAHLIHRELLRIQECKDTSRNGGAIPLHMYKPLAYAHQDECCKFCFVAQVHNFQKELKLRPCITHAQCFLMALDLKPTSCGGRGITWLELYTLYRATGYPKPIANPANASFAKPTMHQQIVAFKGAIRSIGKRCIDSITGSQLLKPFVSHEQHLRGIAIEGSQAALSFNIALSPTMQQFLAAQLIKLTRRCSNDVIQQFLDSNAGLKLTAVSLKGKAFWDDNISKNACTSITQRRDIESLHDIPPCISRQKFYSA